MFRHMVCLKFTDPSAVPAVTTALDKTLKDWDQGRLNLPAEALQAAEPQETAGRAAASQEKAGQVAAPQEKTSQAAVVAGAGAMAGDSRGC